MWRAYRYLREKTLKNKGFINLKFDKKMLFSLKNDEYLTNEYLTVSWENMFPKTGLLLKDVLQNIFFQLKNKEGKFVISVPNDEDNNLEPNNISVNIETKDFKMFRDKVGMPIAIS